MNVHRLRRAAVALAALGATVALAACGGGESTTAASVTLKPLMPANSMKGMKMEGESSSGGMKMEEETSSSGMKMESSDAHGSATLRQKGDHLTGTIEVRDLEPGSAHAEHIHGPDGACSPASKMTTNMAVVLPDLEANSEGTAKVNLDLTVHQKVLGPGYFIMVHAKPTPPSQRNEIGSAPASPAFMQALSNDPGILCGDVETSE
jgi:hypothetical protein